jgi:hypothetical protein
VKAVTQRPGLATVPVYGLAAVCLIATHLATNNLLGFHIDELYYRASGRHPAFGYVDYPPIVPLLGRLETAVLGVTPWTFMCTSAKVVAHLVVPYDVVNLESGAPVTFCTLNASLPALWGGLKDFSVAD